MSYKVLALLPWGEVVEDFLDPIGVTLDGFCTEMTGGWLFGYVEALKRSGWRSVILCVSRQVKRVERRVHAPTGATIVLLPRPAAHRLARRGMASAYAASAQDAYGRAPGLPRRVAWQLAPYLATPMPALLRALRQEGCTALMVQEYETPRFDACVLAGRLLGLPVFATFQGGDRHHRRLERFLRPRALARCAGLVIASAAEAARVQRVYGVPAERIARIPNPLDGRLWFPEERRVSDAVTVITHGRIELHRKGLDVLLEAWALLRQARPAQALRLVLVGSGADGALLRARLEALADPGIIWQAGYLLDRAEMRRRLNDADIYALASRHEGFPVAPLEAMACGLPVVAADAPGVPEILDGGEASGGLLVPRGDAPALATALVRLVDDAALRTRMGAAARARVAERFGFEPVGRALDRLLTRGAQTAAPPLAVPEPLH